MKNTHYDAIPERLLMGNILDVGGSHGNNQQKSTRWPLFKLAIRDNRYACLDIERSPIGPTFQGDLLTEGPKLIRQNIVFSTVIASHVLEHMDITQWEHAIPILQGLTAPHGTLCIGTPYIEVPQMARVTGPEHLKHKVHWIDCRLFLKYLGEDVVYSVYKGPYGHAIMAFWERKQ